MNFTMCQGAAMPCHDTAMERAEAELGQAFKHFRTGTEIPRTMTAPRGQPDIEFFFSKEIAA